MKKIFLFLLTVIIAAFGIAGCSGSGTDPNDGGDPPNTETPGGDIGYEYTPFAKGSPSASYAGHIENGSARYAYALTLYDNGVFYLSLGFVLKVAPAPPVFVVLDGEYAITDGKISFTYHPILDETGARVEDVQTVEADIDDGKTIISGFAPYISGNTKAGTAVSLYKFADASEGTAHNGTVSNSFAGSLPAGQTRYVFRLKLYGDNSFTADYGVFTDGALASTGSLGGTYTIDGTDITFTYNATPQGGQRILDANIDLTGYYILNFTPYIDETAPIGVDLELFKA
jgi:hypothetical protein